MDDVDRAKDLEMGHRKAALAHQQERTAEDNNTRPLIINGVRICVDCGCPIPEERLAVRPEAARCIDCKTKKEAASGILPPAELAHPCTSQTRKK